MPDLFSTRNGYSAQPEAPITVREDAPAPFRAYLAELCERCGLRPTAVRRTLCLLLREAPNPGNWSEHPNVADEVKELLARAPWYRVYDLIEALLREMAKVPSLFDRAHFETELNAYFVEKGIGWQIVGDEVRVRGTEASQATVQRAQMELAEAGYPTASAELREAIRDLSRRPEPDLSGAVHHAMAALEAVTRRLSGDDRSTLGELARRSGLIPPPLDAVVAKTWGYASEKGRHVREGRLPTQAEAHLIVGLAAALCEYLTARSHVIEGGQ